MIFRLWYRRYSSAIVAVGDGVRDYFAGTGPTLGYWREKKRRKRVVVVVVVVHHFEEKVVVVVGSFVEKAFVAAAVVVERPAIIV